MNNEPSEQELLIQEMIGAHHLAGASPGLRERVLRAAHDAWEEDTKCLSAGEVSWTAPVFRLAASLAIAVLMISLADRMLIAERQAGRPPRGQVDMAGGLYPEWQGDSAMSKLAQAAAKVALPDRNAAARYIRHQRQVREMLEATASGNG